MNILDMRTVLISYAISNFMCMIVMALLWQQNRRRFSGVDFWLASYALLFVGVSIMALRGLIPDAVSIGAGTPMIMAGAVAMLFGLERFTGRPEIRWPNYLLLGVFIALQQYYAFVSPDLTARNHLFSIVFLVVNAQCAYVVLRDRVDKRLSSSGPAFVFVAMCLVCVFRLWSDASFQGPEDYMRANSFNTLSVISLQMLHVILALALFLMISGRLFAEVEDEIAVREKAEQVLRLSEEKYAKAFNASPDAVVLARLEDGCLVEVNDGFCSLLGYSRDEVLGGTTLDLGIWADVGDRELLVAELLEHHLVSDWRCDFVTRDGIILNGLLAAEIIDVAGERHLLTVVRDITARKQADRIVRIRLELWEFAATHTVHEVMRKALDEIESLTGSAIGFFHFVDADNETLDLQVWSTRTMKGPCDVEGPTHYPLSQAGVWADCTRLGEPIAHNDYQSLPHRKGLPPGHVPLVRELVVPTMRDGKPVAILGVGNKPAAYTDQDVKHALFIADVAWSVIERKQSYEHIVQLNEKLAFQAMTDDLTGMSNRRSFFAQAEEEVRRARRYSHPLSVLMLDLDGFKAVNDTFGHDAGDEILRNVSATLKKGMREIDILGRLGGEEFSILLPNTDSVSAVKLAERLRRAVEVMRCEHQGRTLGITVSIGVSGFHPDMPDISAMLKQADEALYEAKDRGRNRVVGPKEREGGPAG